MPENRPTLRDAALAAADMLTDLDRLGVKAASILLGGFSSDIKIQVTSAFDRAIVAAAFDLLTISKPYGDPALLNNAGTVTVTDRPGHYRVEVYGPAVDRPTMVLAEQVSA